MKRIIGLLVLLLVCIAPAGEVSAASASGSETVWVCGGPNSKRYHKSKKCKGLNRCSKSPKSMSREDANKKGYTACKICYR